jgi:hypothetical protein
MNHIPRVLDCPTFGNLVGLKYLKVNTITTFSLDYFHN